MPAPICLFTYSRLNETRKTIEALQRNYIASESDLFIYSDGPKNFQDEKKVNEVREYIQSITGFKSVKIIESLENMGLAASIINGVTKILIKHESIIVLEDDLICSRNFLNFMNQALVFYRDSPNIQSVNGYSFYLSNNNQEVYFQNRTGSWGWATWSNCWKPDIFNKERIKSVINANPGILNEFKKKCGADLSKMLRDSLCEKRDSWYVRWAFDHFINKHYAVFPSHSFINNIGHNEDATNCKGINSYISLPVNQDKIEFYFPAFKSSDKKTEREFLNYFTMMYKIGFRLKLIKTQTGRVQLFNELKTRIGYL
jgi:hypothetical protein